MKQQYIKIGISSNFKSRLSSLQTGNPETINIIGKTASMPYAEAWKLESDLKRKYRNRKIRGEWFTPSKMMLEDIKNLSL